MNEVNCELERLAWVFESSTVINETETWRSDSTAGTGLLKEKS